MKTNEFIVEYAGIGEDAEEMSQDHEVQLARQECYHAARDAIALHHILKDVSEQEGLESWVSEKLTQAASNLNDVIEHLEALRGGDGEDGMGDIMHAFSMESAEAKYAALLEAQVNELNYDRHADREWNPGVKSPIEQAAPWIIIDKATKVRANKNTYPSARDAMAVIKGNPKYTMVRLGSSVKEETVNELDSSTMQSYLQKRKETPTPKTVHKAVNQANGVRSASEKIHDQLVKKHAIAGGDTRVRESEIDEAFKEVPTHGKTGKPNPNHPNFAKHDADYKAHQAAMRPPRAPAQPKLTLNDVWRQVEHVVGQIFPDGDPIDWMAPWLEKRGYKGWDIGKIIDRAAKANGYTDMYDYWDQLKQQMDADNAYDAQMGESEQVDELSQGTLQSYVPKANRSREKATDDMRQDGYDPKVDDKMGRRAEFTMKAKNKIAQPVKEDATGGGTSVGGIATGVAGAKANKPGTGKPKDLGNKVSRKQVQVGKGVY